jgi:hypothetical protein
MKLPRDQLMSERRVLCFKSTLRLEGRDQQGQEEGERRDRQVPPPSLVPWPLSAGLRVVSERLQQRNRVMQGDPDLS